MLARRSFLKMSAVSGIGVIAFGKASAQSGLNPDIINAAVNTHSMQNANAFYGSLSASDYTNIKNVHQSLYNDCVSKGLDSQFMASIAGVTVNDLLSVQLNHQSILSQVQIFAPDYTEQDLEEALSFIPMDAAHFQPQLTTLQQSGLSPVYTRIMNICNTIAIQNRPTDPSDVATSRFSVVHPDGTPERPFLPPPSDGGGGYNCQLDSAAMLGVGAALAIIGLMAGPLGVLSEVALWGALTTYGSVATTAWGAGHASVCGL